MSTITWHRTEVDPGRPYAFTTVINCVQICAPDRKSASWWCRFANDIEDAQLP